MYSNADLSVTPRPMYPADGRKIPAIYSHPAGLAERLEKDIGPFPFFDFWGPRAGIASSQWIAQAGRRIWDWHRPTLTLIYLPHLDYNLQRLGPGQPDIGRDIRQIDAVCGQLLDYFRERDTRVIVLSEYGVTAVDGAIHINRFLREAGWIRVRPELGLEILDPGASPALPFRTTRSPMSMSRTRLTYPKSERCWKTFRASSRSWTAGISGSGDSIIPVRGIWSPSVRPTSGSPTTIGWTTR